MVVRPQEIVTFLLTQMSLNHLKRITISRWYYKCWYCD